MGTLWINGVRLHGADDAARAGRGRRKGFDLGDSPPPTSSEDFLERDVATEPSDISGGISQHNQRRSKMSNSVPNISQEELNKVRTLLQDYARHSTAMQDLAAEIMTVVISWVKEDSDDLPRETEC